MFTQLFSFFAPHPETKQKMTIFVCGYEASPFSTYKTEIVKALKNTANDSFFNKISEWFKPKNNISYDYVIVPYEEKPHQQIKNLIHENKKEHIVFFVLYRRAQEISFKTAKDYVKTIEKFFSCIVLIGTGECVLRKPRRLDFSEAGLALAQEKRIMHASLKSIEDCKYEPRIIHKTIYPYLPYITMKMSVEKMLNERYPPVLAQIIIDYMPVGPTLGGFL